MPQNTSNKMRNAVKAVRNGMSLRQASATFGVARSTIHAHLNKTKVDEVRLEKSGKLSEADEQRLANWVEYCRHMGFFQISHLRLCEEAASLSKSSGVEQKFNKEWCKYFTQTHAKVKAAMGLYKNRRYFDKQSLEIWFSSLAAFCKDHNLSLCLENPEQIFYCCKLHITENLKIILSFSASGMATPPLLIAANLKDSEIPCQIFDNLVLPRGWVKYNCLDVPYHQDQESIYHYYLEHILKAYLLQCGVHKPILLFTKNESSPPKLQLCELCFKLKIFPVNAYPTAFPLCQTLQNEIWSGIKTITDKKMSSLVDIVKKQLMCKLTKEKIRASFRESGVYPLDMKQVNVEQLPCVQPTSADSEDDENDYSESCDDIEHIDTAEIVVPSEQKCKSRISLDWEEFRHMMGLDLTEAIEKASVAESVVETYSKEFKVLMEIHRKFTAEDDSDVSGFRNAALQDDDPLSGINANAEVGPHSNLELWE